MEQNYEAKAWRTLGQNEHQTEWVRELVSEYRSSDKNDLLGWLISMIDRHGADGDATIDWVEAWSEDPDDDWSILSDASHETIESLADQLMEGMQVI